MSASLDDEQWLEETTASLQESLAKWMQTLSFYDSSPDIHDNQPAKTKVVVSAFSTLNLAELIEFLKLFLQYIQKLESFLATLSQPRTPSLAEFVIVRFPELTDFLVRLLTQDTIVSSSVALTTCLIKCILIFAHSLPSPSPISLGKRKANDTSSTIKRARMGSDVETSHFESKEHSNPASTQSIPNDNESWDAEMVQARMNQWVSNSLFSRLALTDLPNDDPRIVLLAPLGISRSELTTALNSEYIQHIQLNARSQLSYGNTFMEHDYQVQVENKGANNIDPGSAHVASVQRVVQMPANRDAVDLAEEICDKHTLALAQTGSKQNLHDSYSCNPTPSHMKHITLSLFDSMPMLSQTDHLSGTQEGGFISVFKSQIQTLINTFVIASCEFLSRSADPLYWSDVSSSSLKSAHSSSTLYSQQNWEKITLRLRDFLLLRYVDVNEQDLCINPACASSKDKHIHTWKETAIGLLNPTARLLMYLHFPQAFEQHLYLLVAQILRESDTSPGFVSKDYLTHACGELFGIRPESSSLLQPSSSSPCTLPLLLEGIRILEDIVGASQRQEQVIKMLSVLSDMFKQRVNDLSRPLLLQYEYENSSAQQLLTLLLHHDLAQNFYMLDTFCDIIKDNLACSSLSRKDWFELWCALARNRHWVDFALYAIVSCSFSPHNTHNKDSVTKWLQLVSFFFTPAPDVAESSEVGTASQCDQAPSVECCKQQTSMKRVHLIMLCWYESFSVKNEGCGKVIEPISLGSVYVSLRKLIHPEQTNEDHKTVDLETNETFDSLVVRLLVISLPACVFNQNLLLPEAVSSILDIISPSSSTSPCSTSLINLLWLLIQVCHDLVDCTYHQDRNQVGQDGTFLRRSLGPVYCEAAKQVHTQIQQALAKVEDEIKIIGAEQHLSRIMNQTDQFEGVESSFHRSAALEAKKTKRDALQVALSCGHAELTLLSILE